MISAAQCRGARAMLGWSQTDLAEKAGVSRATIVDFERGYRVPHSSNLEAVEGALRVAGAEFASDGSEGVSLRMAILHLVTDSVGTSQGGRAISNKREIYPTLEIALEAVRARWPEIRNFSPRILDRHYNELRSEAQLREEMDPGSQ